jgi:hypothetical protein
MHRFRFALALFATLALAACYPPTTSHPVGSTVGLKADPALTGVWKGIDHDGKAHYVHFLHQSDGTLTILIVETGDKAEDWYSVTATTAQLGANRLMNAKLLWTDNKPETDIPGTVPVLYRFDAKGTLTLALMNEDAAKAAILAGKIKGTVEKGAMGDAVITAAPATLDKFMASPEVVKLFAAPAFILHRVE